MVESEDDERLLFMGASAMCRGTLPAGLRRPLCTVFPPTFGVAGERAIATVPTFLTGVRTVAATLFLLPATVARLAGARCGTTEAATDLAGVFCGAGWFRRFLVAADFSDGLMAATATFAC